MKQILASILGLIMPLSTFGGGADDIYFISCHACKATVAALSLDEPSSDSVVHSDDAGLPISGNCTRKSKVVSCVMQNAKITSAMKFYPIEGLTDELQTLVSPDGTSLIVNPKTQTASYIIPISTKTKTQKLLFAGAKVCHCSLRKQ